MADDPVAEFLAREDGALEHDLANEPVVNGGSPILNGFGQNDSGVDLAAQAEEPPRVNGRGASPASSVNSARMPPQEEPESIRRWREEHQKAIQAKDEAEEKQKAELREQAKKELESWQKQKAAEIADRKQKNRAHEEQHKKELASNQTNGSGWSEVAKLIESPKPPPKNAPDVSRMKALIQEHNETAA